MSAFWVGLLYDQSSLDAAWDLVKDWNEEERQYLRENTPRTALHTKFRDTTVQAIARQVLEPLKIRPEQLLVSIAAGIDSESLKLWTSDTQPIVRCMPNTPALLGAGMTALYANEYCDNDHQQTANTILSSAGKTVWVDQESKLDAVTAVSGSGPAYFFALMEAMVEAGVSLGLDREMATQLTVQTGVGAALMADRTDDNPATLRANVTSPGGTTEAALTVMRDAGFNEIMRDALDAAARRSQTLAREFGGKI